MTSKEQYAIFGKLKVLSDTSSNWELFVRDSNSNMKFIASTDGTYISGPNNERVNAKLAIDSKLKGDTASEFAELFEKMRQTRNDLNHYSDSAKERSLLAEQESMIIKYNQLLAERKRLLKKTDKKNPVIVNLDQQIEALRKSAFGDGEIVPFAKVEQVPIFPGCEDAADKRACFQEKIQRHISKNFRYPEEAQKKGIQGRVAVMFTISQSGAIGNIKTRGPDKVLEKEAERIIARLPDMKPGKHKGKVVRVPFSIPITFKLDNDVIEFRKNLNLDNLTEKTPLYVIDGEESTKEAMNLINPNDIASINVLKGETALNVYGEKGKNGVLLVKTKKNSASIEESDEIYKADTNTIAVSARAKDKNGAKLISGTVTDGSMALPGVTIGIEGTERGTISDFNGKFELRAKKGDGIILQYIGLPVLKFTVTEDDTYEVVKKK